MPQTFQFLQMRHSQLCPRLMSNEVLQQGRTTAHIGWIQVREVFERIQGADFTHVVADPAPDVETHSPTAILLMISAYSAEAP